MASLLADRLGTWTGTNSFHLTPTDPEHTAPATVVVQRGQGGTTTTIGYSWTHPQDGDQAGLLTFGPGPEPGTVVAFWGDAWHQSPEAKLLLGRSDDEGFVVGYDYAEGEWRWEIAVEPGAEGQLELRMDNIDLTGDTPRYSAMTMELHPL
jgi:hypothetical protein